MGRPTKLTQALQERFCTLVADGWMLAHAAAECGIGETTLHRWLSDGGKDDAPDDLAGFRESCDRARALAERIVLKSIEDTAGQQGTDWKAQQWRLQVMNPRRFKPADKTELSGPEEGPIRLDLTKLSDAELERIASGNAPPGSGRD